MERQTYEKGRLICQKDEKAESLFLIQDGIVEVALKYDRRREDQNFVIERLARGAIINHRSFMVRDDADTDFVCLTTVSVFVLNYNKFYEIKRKRQDLK
jgi:CRP-like cAMP-binding protein